MEPKPVRLGVSDNLNGNVKISILTITDMVSTSKTENFKFQKINVSKIAQLLNDIDVKK